MDLQVDSNFGLILRHSLLLSSYLSDYFFRINSQQCICRIMALFKRDLMRRTKLPSRKTLIYTLTSCIYYPTPSLKLLTGEIEQISKVLFSHFYFFSSSSLLCCIACFIFPCKKNLAIYYSYFCNYIANIFPVYYIANIFPVFYQSLIYFTSFFIVAKYT